MTIPPDTGAEAFQRITNVSRETICDYQTWYNLLTHWNKKINLVSSNTIHNYWLRHVLDSHQLFNLAPFKNEKLAQNWLDLGSGAGFPGLAIALSLKHGAAPETVSETVNVTLVEATGKKCNFLRAVIRELGLPATVVQARVEDLPAKPCDIITARAFAPLPKLLEYSLPFWSVDKSRPTIAIFPKGRGWKDEVDAAQNHWDFSYEAVDSQTDDEAKILIVSGLARKKALSCDETDKNGNVLTRGEERESATGNVSKGEEGVSPAGKIL
ncbi:MAG: 16S rRNA (guanine(527)-N(7))-methyltransferase RsmG [Robiginitomaculum sp.]|nr:MAG: 16S rRNA (guanine(527)-N(7))-methyltransferase RsmG [Robiginitomaculum sp.]